MEKIKYLLWDRRESASFLTSSSSLNFKFENFGTAKYFENHWQAFIFLI